MKNLGKQRKTSEVSFIADYMIWKRKSKALKTKQKGQKSQFKKMGKLNNKIQAQNIQEIWDTMKRPNLRIIGIEEGEKKNKGQRYRKYFQQKSQKKIYRIIKKKMPIKVQGAQHQVSWTRKESLLGK